MTGERSGSRNRKHGTARMASAERQDGRLSRAAGVQFRHEYEHAEETHLYGALAQGKD